MVGSGREPHLARTSSAEGEVELLHGSRFTGFRGVDPSGEAAIVNIDNRWHVVGVAEEWDAPLDLVSDGVAPVGIDEAGATYWDILGSDDNHNLVRIAGSDCRWLAEFCLPITRVIAVVGQPVIVVTYAASPPYQEVTWVVQDNRRHEISGFSAVGWASDGRLVGMTSPRPWRRAALVGAVTGAREVIGSSRREFSLSSAYGPVDCLPHELRNGSAGPFGDCPASGTVHWRHGTFGHTIVSGLCQPLAIHPFGEKRSTPGRELRARRRRFAYSGRNINVLESRSHGHQLVVRLIGGPGTPVLDAFDPITSGLVDAGATVWTPSLSGYAGFGRAMMTRIWGCWGVHEWGEIRELVGHARAEGYERVSIFGHSYGAYLALHCGGMPVDDVVAWGPFASVESLWEETPSSRLLLARWGLAASERRSRLADDEGRRLVTCPTLVLIGQSDRETPETPSVVGMTEDLARNRLSRTVRLPIGHSASRPDEQQLVLGAILEFWDELG